MVDRLVGVDTVALLAYFTDNLGEQSQEIFDHAENSEKTLLIPEIVIGELLYTIFKGRNVFGDYIDVSQSIDIVESLHSHPMFLIRPLTQIGWKIFLSSNIPELHDRMIVATCKQDNVAVLVTRDEDIIKSKEIQCVW